MIVAIGSPSAFDASVGYPHCAAPRAGVHALFLAGDAAANLVGAVLPANGGRFAI